VKRLLLVGAISVGVSCAVQASIITAWTGDLTGAFLYDSAGSALDPTGLRIELVLDQGTTTVFSEFAAGAIGLTGDSSGW